MTKTRFAVVGAGWISQEAFLPAVTQSGNAEVAAIVSGSRAAADKLAAFHDIPQVVDYDGYDALLASGKVDAVYIALPNSLHADYAMRAAKAGVHALVEKPLAVDEAESQSMIDAFAQAGVYLMTAYRLHAEAGTLRLLDRVRAGEIGDVRHVMSHMTFQAAPDNHRLKAEHWGGPLQDLGVYCINAMRHIMGAEPVEVFAMSTHGDGDARFAEVEESVCFTLRFPGDRVGQACVSFGTDLTDTLTVLGTTGTLVMDHAYRFETEPETRLLRGYSETAREVAPESDHFAGMVAYFADCIQSGTAPVTDGREGLADMRVLRAIEASLAHRRPVQLAPAPLAARLQPDMVRTRPRTQHRLVL